jgi:hypothetical protein
MAVPLSAHVGISLSSKKLKCQHWQMHKNPRWNRRTVPVIFNLNACSLHTVPGTECCKTLLFPFYNTLSMQSSSNKTVVTDHENDNVIRTCTASFCTFDTLCTQCSRKRPNETPTLSRMLLAEAQANRPPIKKKETYKTIRCTPPSPKLTSWQCKWFTSRFSCHYLVYSANVQ